VTLAYDLLRTQVKDLLDAWQDNEGHIRDALLRMLAKHLQPVHLSDSDQSVKAKITAGPPPWETEIAHLLADVSAGARKMERGLDIANGFNPRDRGGSDGNTRIALSRIPDLVETLAARYPDGSRNDLIAEPRVTIGAWHRAALLLLGAERRWAHIRAEVEVHNDAGDTIDTYPGLAVCPYCESAVRIQPDVADEGDTTRHLPDRSATSYGSPAAAFCVNKGCTDEAGHRYSWPVDPWLGQLLMWKRDGRQQKAS
jgi:hypothetical protein